MEIPSDNTTRIGNLPIELRNMLKSYVVIPQICIHSIELMGEALTGYTIEITYSDLSICYYKVHIPYDIDVHFITEQLSMLTKGDFAVVELGGLCGEYSINIYMSSRMREIGLSRVDREYHVTNLSKDAFTILIVKLRLMLSDYLKYKADPVKYKMNEKY